MEPLWEWQAPEDSEEQATAHKLKRPQKTLLHPLVFHTENQFSRVFPRSSLASLVSLFIFPWLLAKSSPLSLLLAFEAWKWKGSWAEGWFP